MSVKKANALTKLYSLLNAALKYRNEPYDSLDVMDDFDPHQGLCGNLERLNYRGLNNLKNNLVAHCDSYSGNYHYPVSPANSKYPDNAERAHDSLHAWDDVYGGNRVTMLREIIEICESFWEDSFLESKSQAERRGFVIGQVYKELSSGKNWVFIKDDATSCPLFKSNSDGERSYCDLDNFEKPELFKFKDLHLYENKSVKFLVNKHRTNNDKIDVIDYKIRILLSEQKRIARENSLLDRTLRRVHSVSFVG